jgi:hypothetical protein
MSGNQEGGSISYWLALSALIAALVGVGAGILLWQAHREAAAAVLKGAAAFGATLTLALLIIETVRRRR